MKLYTADFTLDWKPQRLVIAGYTGRDQEAVKKHIDELLELGVPAPRRVPMIYDLSPELLRTSEEISVVCNDSSGEAEVVLLDVDGSWYVGLGSDHTDRVLEAVSVQKSKQVCAKPMAREVWPLDSIADHWDEIELRSWVTINGEEQLYQSGRLDAFLAPQDLLDIVRQRDYAAPNMALFCGTLALIDGQFQYGEAFRAELLDNKTNRSISLSYEVKQLKNAEEDE
ncbi:DUF2848 domain-containing protein [Brevibacillus humidisoli]|uniref:DUF2848 domain-containing protein n=1 Tax=Brevibacillus humidisoli TaxID=2895522 RepID=UPI001E5DF166|nr:DUF2848 domain-containing protein [Brevibacillus humidisoli]UFJ41398.1 DUF2848 domain-containing protein [Brevibacillus humidisoli]